MEREEILKIASEHFTALYITWNEPTGKPDWSLIKDKLSCPASEEQLIAFAKAIAAHEREEVLKFVPNLMFESNEPSLTGLVRRYYSQYFEPAEAAEWTEEYLSAIRARRNK